jgi:hypothetical protein
VNWIVKRFLDRIPHCFVCDACEWVGLDHGASAEGRRKVRGDARRHRLWGCRPDFEWVGRNISRFDLLGMRRLVGQCSDVGSPVAARPISSPSAYARRQES